mmetsp:Transcript_30684/g.52693  ORF Transcript_30684/g.52693 Transcript_30684/m.52693 type:complete len:243 (-) Transcript_30684:140-868(-)
MRSSQATRSRPRRLSPRSWDALAKLLTPSASASLSSARRSSSVALDSTTRSLPSLLAASLPSSACTWFRTYGPCSAPCSCSRASPTRSITHARRFCTRSPPRAPSSKPRAGSMCLVLAAPRPPARSSPTHSRTRRLTCSHMEPTLRWGCRHFLSTLHGKWAKCSTSTWPPAMLWAKRPHQLRSLRSRRSSRATPRSGSRRRARPTTINRLRFRRRPREWATAARSCASQPVLSVVTALSWLA